MNTKVIITAEDQTSAGINSVKSSMAGLGATIGVFAAGAAVAAGAIAEIARQTVGLWKDQINLADSMDEMSVRMGMSIKEMTGWQAAAEMNGTSLESMAAGTRMLAKHMVEHGAALRKAGIDTKDTNKAFEQLSDLFKGMSDPVARLDLATRLFGRGLGQQLLPMLVQGSEAMRDIRKETDPYGAALTKLAPEAQKFNDQMYLLGVNVKTMAAESVLPLVQRLNEAADSFKKAREAGLSFFQAVTGFGVRDITESVDDAKRNAPRHIADLLEQRKLLESRDPRPEINLGKDTLIAGIKEIDKKIAYFRSLQGVRPGDEGEALPPGISDTDAQAIALKAGIGKPGKDAKGKAAAKTPLQKMIELGEHNLAAAKSAEYVAVDDDEESRLGAHKREMESLRLQAREAEGLAKHAEKIKDSVDPLRVLAREIAEVNQLREAGLLSAAQASDAEDDLTQKFAKQRESMLDLKKTGQDSFSGIRESIENMGNKAADTFAELLVTGKASFSDLITSWLKDLARLEAKKMMDPITKGAGDWLGGLFDGLFGGGAGSMSGNGSVQGNANYIWDLHSGGIAGSGEGSGRHMRNLAMFAGAPKYHGGGLAGDEVPAVLKRGEGVFTPGQMKALGGGTGDIRVELINSGTAQKVTGAQPSVDMKGMVLRIFTEDIAQGGRASKQMESTYGLNRAAGAM